jgi:hypothetical protein
MISCLLYFRHGDILLYGDAVAHINIARRVFDSLTPGLLQLGTVWLPLPHVLMIPFLYADSAWRSGVGGSIPSMVAYVLGAAGIFRLVRGELSSGGQADSSARLWAWIAALVYAANPSLLYMQSTAMTEPQYLAWFIWAVVHFGEFAHASHGDDPQIHADVSSALTKCALCLAGACLTRYDGWFLTGAIWIAVAVVFVQSGMRFKKAVVRFTLIAAAAPVLWLGYNAAVYGNALEFANGPYSAHAIEQRSATPGYPPHPGWHNPPVAFSYFLKSAEQTLAEGTWQKAWVVLLLAGIFVVLTFRRKLWPLLLLIVPLLFYTLSIAYGSVPIFLPEWWPFSYYNVRFGLEILPASAAMVAVLGYFLQEKTQNKYAQTSCRVALLAFVAASYTTVWRAQPICFREAWVNSRSRIALETEVARNLELLPHDAILLMYLGDHVGALQQAGIPLHQVINEGNHRPWLRPSDPQGLWERALADPRQYADYVIAMDGDPVAVGANHQDLTSVVRIRTVGQPAATIYWTHRPLR